MKIFRRRIGGLSVLLTALLFIGLGANTQAQPGTPFQNLQNQIDELGDELADLTRRRPLRYRVNCDNGRTVSQLLDRINNSQVPARIVIRGNCNENVMVVRDNLTFEGETLSDGINGTVNGAFTVTDGASSITIKDMTIAASSSGWGIACFKNSAVTIENVLITDAVYGVHAKNGGLCHIDSSTVENSTHGALIFDSGLLMAENTIFRDNAFGITLDGDSGADLTSPLGSPTIIENNTIYGVLARYSSHVNFANTQIRNNTGLLPAVRIGFSSSARFGATNITQNTGTGLAVEANTSITWGFGAQISIDNNGGYGLECFGDAAFSSGLNEANLLNNTLGEQDGCDIIILPLP